MSYPSTVSSFTNPSASDKLNSPSHSSIETAQNTGLTEIQTFVGTLSSVQGTLMYDVRAAASDGGGHVQGVNKGGTGLTSYTKGDLLVATSSSVLAKLSVGQDNLVLTADSNQQAGIRWSSVASGSAGTAGTVVPFPVTFLDPSQSAPISTGLPNPSPSSMVVGMVSVPYQITANSLSLQHGDMATAGQFLISMYLGDGSRSILTASTATITQTSASIVSIPLSSILVTPGNYYVGVSPISSTVGALYGWATAVGDSTIKFLASVQGKPVTQGTVSIVAGSHPASINGLLTNTLTNQRTTLLIRLDN